MVYNIVKLLKHFFWRFYMKSRSNVLKYSILLSFMMLCFILAGSHRSFHAATVKSIVVGQTKQLKKTATGWVSRKPTVATVSETGLVTALRPGTTKVTAVRGRKKYTWKIKVVAPTLNKSEKTLKVNKSFTLKLKNSPTKFTWSVSDPSVLKLTKKSKYKYKVKGLRNGTAQVIVQKGTYMVICNVVVGTGVTDEENSKTNDSSSNSGSTGTAAADTASQYQTLYMDGNVFKQMTYQRSDVAKYVSSISGYGQSAPLFIHKDGGDGLENIWAATNNGAVGVANQQLSADAVQGTIAKACLWARAIADSDYHGYDFGHSYKGANLLYTFGQAKPNGLGTGDYCCSTIPLCAYYFAGVNVLGENLGGSDAKYIPESTKLFYEGSWGEITFYENGTLTGSRYLSNYEWKIFNACGFTDVVKQYRKNKKSFVFKAGDVVTANGHTQLVLTDGTQKTAETVQAYGPDKTKNNNMPKGGDQSGSELGRAYYVRTSPKIQHIMRFTGAGVVLNTVGLTS